MATYTPNAPQPGYTAEPGYTSQTGYVPQPGYTSQTGYVPQPGYTAQPVYAPPMNQFVPAPEIRHIRDWLPWSIINLIFGWGLGGVIPLIFSIICRSSKRSNDVKNAQLMSTLALVFNIIITLGGIAAWVGFIIWLVFYIRTLNDILNYR